MKGTQDHIEGKIASTLFALQVQQKVSPEAAKEMTKLMLDPNPYLPTWDLRKINSFKNFYMQAMLDWDIAYQVMTARRKENVMRHINKLVNRIKAIENKGADMSQKEYLYTKEETEFIQDLIDFLDLHDQAIKQMIEFMDSLEESYYRGAYKGTAYKEQAEMLISMQQSDRNTIDVLSSILKNRMYESKVQNQNDR